MATIIDALLVTLGIDASGFKKGQSDQKVALDAMRNDAEQTQTAIDALQAKSARQKRQNAQEERKLADQISAIKRNSTDATKAEDDKLGKSLQSQLTAKRTANREQATQTEEEILSQKKILSAKQRGIKDSEKGQKQQLDQTKKTTLETRNESTAVQELTGRIISLFAAFTAGEGLASFVKKTTEGAAELGILADNLGLPIERLDAFEGAFEQIPGVTKQAAADALQTMVDFREKMKLGQMDPNQAKFAAAFGLRVEDLADPINALKKISAMKKSLGMSDARFSILAKGLGLDQPAINALEVGPEKLAEYEDAARKAGVTTKHLSDESRKLYADWMLLGRASSHLGQILLDELDPAIEWLTEALTRLAEYAQNHMAATTAVVGGLAGALTALTVISFVGLISAIGGIGLALAPVLIAATAVGAALGFIAWRGNVKARDDADKNVANRQKVLASAKQALAERKKKWEISDLWHVSSAGSPGDGISVADAEAAVRHQEQLLAAAIKARDNIPANTTTNAPVAGNGAPVAGHGGGPGTRASRNNNPGNIEDGAFARSQAGYVGGDGRFAKFSTPDAGLHATEELVRRKINKGNSLSTLISAWAPPSENNTGAYISAVERDTGISRDAKPTTEHAHTIALAIARHEGFDLRKLGNALNPIGTAEAAPAHKADPVKHAPMQHPPAVHAATAPPAPAHKAAHVAPRAAAHPPAVHAPTRHQPAAHPAPRAVTPAPPAPITPAPASAPSPTPPTREPVVSAPTPPVGSLAQAAAALINAAQALLSSAVALRGNQPIPSPRAPQSPPAYNMPSSYDRGLNVGASVSYAHHVVSNDNSQRIEAATHIGQINLHGVGDGVRAVRDMERVLRHRSLAYNAASGLF